jgi:hypothetical protein
MSVALLIALRDAITADAVINGFFTARYAKPLTHLIGYDKGSANARDRPMLCYVPARQKIGKTGVKVVAAASVVVQLIEKDTTDGVRDGVLIADQAVSLVQRFMQSAPLPAAGFTDFVVVTDLGSQHPFYEIELAFNYHYRG